MNIKDTNNLSQPFTDADIIEWLQHLRSIQFYGQTSLQWEKGQITYATEQRTLKKDAMKSRVRERN